MIRTRLRADPLARYWFPSSAQRDQLRSLSYGARLASRSEAAHNAQQETGSNSRGTAASRRRERRRKKSAAENETEKAQHPQNTDTGPGPGPGPSTTNDPLPQNSVRPAFPSDGGIWSSLREKLKDLPSSSLARDSVRQVRNELKVAVRREEGSKSARKSKAKKTSSQSDSVVSEGTIDPDQLQLRPIGDDVHQEVPPLAHGLDRVLFNPGVYQIQDHRSGVFNFDPYLATIMPNDEFDFDALKSYVTSSKDVKLREMAAAHGAKYSGSTSSMTGILSHFHYLLSAWRPLHFKALSRSFQPESLRFTQLSRGPAAAFLSLKDGVYALDSDKQFDTDNVLSLLGRSMEKHLTLPKEEFEKYRRTQSHKLSDEEKNADEQHHYTTLGDFIMRSQLDAHDPRLPGSGVFDLKTRAVVTIRMDVRGYEKGTGYEIRKRFGAWESYDREYYDMIRAAFLKYSLQVRMGRMDGIFAAYHNTQRIFGFQYIPLEEMDESIHGSSTRHLGDDEFKASVTLFNELLNRATERFPGRSLRLHVETRPTKVPLMYFFAEPVTEQDIAKTQEKNRSSAEQLEKSIRDIRHEKGEDESTPDDEGDDAHAEGQHDEQDAPRYRPLCEYGRAGSWEKLMTKVDEAVKDKSQGLVAVRDGARETLDQAGLLKGRSVSDSAHRVNALAEALITGWEESVVLRPTAEDDLLSDESEKQSLEQAGASEDKTPVDGAEEQPEPQREEHPGPQQEEQSGPQQEEQPEPQQEEQPRPKQKSDSEAGESGLGPSLREASESSPPSDEGDAERSSLQDAVSDFVEAVKEESGHPDAFACILDEMAQLQKSRDPESTGKSVFTFRPPPADGGLDELAANTRSDRTGKEASGATKRAGPPRELLGMYITVRNTVGGRVVARPTPGSGAPLNWEISYKVTELPEDKAWKIYMQMKRRRRGILNQDPVQASRDWHRMFGGKLPVISKHGEDFRQEVEKREAGKSKLVAWDKEPMQ